MRSHKRAINERFFSPLGCYSYLLWATKKMINKIGSSGKRSWYRFWNTYPWEPRKLGFIESSQCEQTSMKHGLERLPGVTCLPVSIKRDTFYEFTQRWENITIPYDTFHKKSLEYFLTVEFMNFQPTDVYMDIGSWISPFPEMIRETVKKVYCQDISYRPGFYKDQIGCNAAHIPLPNESIDKMSLHCTFEHFEGDNDTLFIREASRLLRPGGKCFIVPLYISNNFVNITDPSLFSLDRLRFDEGAMIHKRFGFLNKFGRIYSPVELERRIIQTLNGLKPIIYWIEEVSWLPITRYMHFALMLEKTHQ